MRLLAILLALCATTKIVVIESLHRQAGDEVIVAAYGARALEACGREARQRFGVDPGLWSRIPVLQVDFGHGASDVALWQVDNPHWSSRYRRAYVRATAGAAGNAVECRYDVLAGTAITRRL